MENLFVLWRFIPNDSDSMFTSGLTPVNTSDLSISELICKNNVI